MEKLPMMAGALEKMMFEQESIAEVRKPGEGDTGEFDYMIKINEMKENRRRQIEKQKQDELLMMARQKKMHKDKPSARSLAGKSDNG